MPVHNGREWVYTGKEVASSMYLDEEDEEEMNESSSDSCYSESEGMQTVVGLQIQ